MDTVRQYQQDIKAFPDFRNDSVSTADLVSRMNEPDMVAKTMLIQSTLNYILKLAHSYCRRENAWRHLIDLVQEANRRVSERILKFDPKKGSLKTFVYFCSDTAFSDYSSETGIVTIPRYQRRMMRYYRYACSELSRALGREPTDEEVSQLMQISQARVQEIRRFSGVGFVELDAPAGKESIGMTKGDLLASFEGQPEIERLEQAAEVTKIYELAVESMGKTEADLWKAYKEGDRELFYEYYRNLTGKGKLAARAFISRRHKKLKKFIQKKTRRSKLGGTHEFPEACSG